MKVDGAFIAPSDFSERFTSAWKDAQTRFLKVERKQSYNQGGDSSYEAFVRGDYETAQKLLKDELLQQREMYSDAQTRGLELVRIRQFEEPLSDYLRYYEIPSYFVSEELGETIWFARPDPAKDELPDCIIFDSEVLFVNTYDSLDRLAGAVEIRDKEQINVASIEAAKLLASAERLSSFVSSHGLHGPVGA
jgi:hypothetical protein